MTGEKQRQVVQAAPLSTSRRSEPAPADAYSGRFGAWFDLQQTAGNTAVAQTLSCHRQQRGRSHDNPEAGPGHGGHRLPGESDLDQQQHPGVGNRADARTLRSRCNPTEEPRALLAPQLQRTAGNMAVGEAIHSAYRASQRQAGALAPRGVGEPLAGGLRADMETLLGADFREVRVHTDAEAGQTAQLLGALAYSVGPDIVFRSGQYAPGTRQGRHLLGHELAHVAQSADRRPPPTMVIGEPHDPLETVADRAASLVADGHPAPTAAAGPSAVRLTPDPRLVTILERIRALRGSEAPESTVQRILEIIEGIDLSDPDNLLPIASAVDNTFTGAGRKAVLDLFGQQVQARAGRRGPTPEEQSRMDRQIAPLQARRSGPYGQPSPGVLLPIAAQTARPLLPVYEALAESAALRTIAGGLLGEFNEHPTFGMISVDLAVSLVPILNAGADLRDLNAHLYFLAGHRQYDRPLRWVGLAFTLIGFVPAVGSAIKSASKFFINGAGEVVGHLGDVLGIARRIAPEIADLPRFQRFIARNWDSYLTRGLALWTETLNQVSGLVRLIPEAFRDRRRLFDDALKQVRELSPAKLRAAFNWIKNKIEEVIDKLTSGPVLALPGGGSVPESALGAGTHLESRAVREGAGGTPTGPGAPSTTGAHHQTAAERDWEKAEAQRRQQEAAKDIPERTEHGALREQKRGRLTAKEKERLESAAFSHKQPGGETAKVLKDKGLYTVAITDPDGVLVTEIRNLTSKEVKKLSREHYWDPPW